MWGKALLKLKILPAILLAGYFFANITLYAAKAYTLPKHDLQLTVVAMGREYSFTYPEIDYYNGKPYLKNAKEIVDGIYLDTIIRPIDARVDILVDKDSPFKFTREKEGKAIDKDDLLAKIEDALASRKEKIHAKQTTLNASITIEKLRKSTYRRSSFSTNFAYSSEERKENIRLCAKLIGGVMLCKNQEFSFNKTVGERTEDRGFKNAKIIEKGKFTDGIGGGVCQVSSTVYNAVLLGGLKVTERHPHSLTVSYVEPSFDAMVSMGYADLKFVNTTSSFVFIIAKIEGDNIVISVYGEEPKYTYKRVSEVIEKISPPSYLRIYADALLKGEEKIVVYEKEGLISKGYLEVYQGGKLIKKEFLSYDKYNPLQGEVLYG